LKLLNRRKDNIMADEPKTVTLAEVTKEHPELQTELNAKFEERAARGKEAGRKEAEAEFAPIKSEFEKSKEKLAELDTAKKAAQEAAETVATALAGLLEGVPEAKRSLIPDDLKDAAKIRYIQKNRAFLMENSAAAPPPVTIPGSGKLPEAKVEPVKLPTNAREAREFLKGG
jgi:hypothetical protein